MKRNQFIDVLKGICIIFVIITHYNWSNAARLKYFFPFWIDMAVPIFMIISGYENANCFLPYLKKEFLWLVFSGGYGKEDLEQEAGISLS